MGNYTSWTHSMFIFGPDFCTQQTHWGSTGPNETPNRTESALASAPQHWL